ncbi:MAG: hypothetical protein AAGB26_17505 [Planctomycetota bacterium]
MGMKIWAGIVIIFLAVLILGGLKEDFDSWLTTNVGGWAPTVFIIALALSFVLPPIGLGVIQGMREASKKK